MCLHVFMPEVISKQEAQIGLSCRKAYWLWTFPITSSSHLQQDDGRLVKACYRRASRMTKKAWLETDKHVKSSKYSVLLQLKSVMWIWLQYHLILCMFLHITKLLVRSPSSAYF